MTSLPTCSRQGAITLEARGPADAIRAALQTIPGVERVVAGASRRRTWLVSRSIAADPQDLREAISVKLVSNGWPLRQLDVRAKLARRAVHAGRDAGHSRRRPARGRLIMRHVATLLNRELGAYFLGPMAYLVLLAFQVIAFLNFWELVDTPERAAARALEPARPDDDLHLRQPVRSGSRSWWRSPCSR